MSLQGRIRFSGDIVAHLRPSETVGDGGTAAVVWTVVKERLRGILGTLADELVPQVFGREVVCDLRLIVDINAGVQKNDGILVLSGPYKDRRFRVTAVTPQRGTLRASQHLEVALQETVEQLLEGSATGTAPSDGGGTTTPQLPITDPTLSALADVNALADHVAYFTGPQSAELTPFPTFGRTLAGSTSASAARVSLEGRRVFTFEGAARDGSANVLSLIQAQLDAARDDGGGTVTAPRGLYRIDGALTVYDNTKLELEPGTQFTTPLTGTNHPPAYFTVAGIGVTIRELVFAINVADAHTTVGLGSCVRLAHNAKRVRIIGGEIRGFGYCIEAVGYWEDVGIRGITTLGARVDVRLAGQNVYGKKLTIDRLIALPRSHSVPYGPAGILHIAGGVKYFEGPVSLTESILDTQRVEDVTLRRIVFGATGGRPCAVVNAARVHHSNSNSYNQLVGSYLDGGEYSHDNLTFDQCDVVTGGPGTMEGGGENGVDFLSCRNFAFAGGSIKRCNSAGVFVGISDAYLQGPTASIAKTRLECHGSIDIPEIEASKALVVASGRVEAWYRARQWAGSTNFAAHAGTDAPYGVGVLVQAQQLTRLLVAGKGKHTGGTSADLVDSTAYSSGYAGFPSIGITTGMTVKNHRTGATMPIDAFATTVTANDTAQGTLSSGDWQLGDVYEVLDFGCTALKVQELRLHGAIDRGPRIDVTADALTGTFTTRDGRAHGLTTGEAVEFEWAGSATRIFLPAKLVGTHDGGASGVLIDTTRDFEAEGVEPGDIVLNGTDAGTPYGIVTAITTTTNPNDTLVAAMSTGTWANSEIYRIPYHPTRNYFVIADENDETVFRLAATFQDAIAESPVAIPIADAGSAVGGTASIGVRRTYPFGVFVDGLQFDAFVAETFRFNPALAQHTGSLERPDLIFSQLGIAPEVHTNLGGAALTHDLYYCRAPHIDFGSSKDALGDKWAQLPPFYLDFDPAHPGDPDFLLRFGVNKQLAKRDTTTWSPGERIMLNAELNGILRQVSY